MRKNDNRWQLDGTYLVLTRPRSLGETIKILAYSMDYGRAWRYFMFNPDGLPDQDGWMLAQRRNGATVPIKKPIPPDRLKRKLAQRTQASA